MFKFGGMLLSSLYTLILKILGLVYKYVYRSKLCVAEENSSNLSANHAQKDDQVVSGVGKESLDFQKNKEDSIARTEDPVFLLNGLISNTSKYQVFSGNNVSGFLEEPKTMKFVVQEMFVESEEVSMNKDLLEEKNLQEFDEESKSGSFYFNLFDNSCFNVAQEHASEVENLSQESAADDSSKGVCIEEVFEEREKPSSEDFRVEKDEILEEHGLSNEVELSSQKMESPENWIDNFLNEADHSKLEDIEKDGDADHARFVIMDMSREVEKDEILEEHGLSDEVELSSQKMESPENWIDNFLNEADHRKLEDLEKDHNADHARFIIMDLSKSVEDSDDEYIELEPLKASQKGGWDSESDDDEDEDEDELDALQEHQNLVQQMKMELKNCRIGGLPTISEECETPKMVEDLKPLKIDQKIEYKDIMEEIHKFYKSYMEKIRKLDILNYQTLHAISFMQLKGAEVFTAGKKKADSVPFVLRKILPCKVQRIYADPVHKPITELHRDLELVYVAQLCLSWEILSWMYVKARELLEHDSEGRHSYNRAAEQFQQFQVLMQRFMEDEPFQEHRNRDYVKSRCMIRSLLQVPTIKDDCLRTKKERNDEKDVITLEVLVGIMWESMLIFQEFVFADKKATKVDLQEPPNSELLSEIILNLQKKERRIRDQIRSQNCIVKKLRKNQECRLDYEILTCEVELRLVSRVLNLSRLTTDQLVWCQKKLNSISFVGRKVHIEPSFLLFPC